MAFAAIAGAQAPPIEPSEMVRTTTANELRAADSAGRFRYHLQERKAHSSKTEDMIETKDWRIHRLIQINENPLTAEQRAMENQRINRLLTDQAELRKQLAKQRKDARRVRQIVQALPEAFLYSYDPADKEDVRNGIVWLRFIPNPAFVPRSTEQRALQGMEGRMLINTATERFARVQAKLIRRVSYVWGVLGWLNKGGTFLLEQHEVCDGRWHVTTLGVHFTGRIMLFKKLNINSTLLSSDFQCSHEELTLVQALEMLMKESEMKKTISPR
jgi:hypothetical protein